MSRAVARNAAPPARHSGQTATEADMAVPNGRCIRQYARPVVKKPAFLSNPAETGLYIAVTAIDRSLAATVGKIVGTHFVSTFKASRF